MPPQLPQGLMRIKEPLPMPNPHGRPKNKSSRHARSYYRLHQGVFVATTTTGPTRARWVPPVPRAPCVSAAGCAPSPRASPGWAAYFLVNTPAGGLSIPQNFDTDHAAEMQYTSEGKRCTNAEMADILSQMDLQPRRRPNRLPRSRNTLPHVADCVFVVDLEDSD